MQFAIKAAINEPDLASILQILDFKVNLSCPLYLFASPVVREGKWSILTHDTGQTDVSLW